jgi:hypothetical protein
MAALELILPRMRLTTGTSKEVPKSQGMEGEGKRFT